MVNIALRDWRRSMRESVMAFSPLVAVIYFVVFPSQLNAILLWMAHLLR
jgi:hypothetical protein